MVLTQPDPPPDGGGGVVSPDGSTVSNIRNSITRFWNNQVRTVTPPGQRPTFIAPSANNNIETLNDVEERLQLLRNGGTIPQTTPSSQVSDVSHSSKLAFLHGASIDELQQALSIKMNTGTDGVIQTKASNPPPNSEMQPRMIFPATVAPTNSPNDSTPPNLPIGLEVFCRVNGTIMAGEIASAPTPSRNFYLVHSHKTDNFFEVPNNTSDIWEDTSGISKRSTSTSPAPAPVASSNTEATQLRKELWHQRQRTDFKRLPTCGKECMTYHDDMYILLGCKAWRTKSCKHILDAFVTTPETQDLSSELYHLLTRGTTIKGTAATEAFPIMKDPDLVDKGLECYWSIFQQFCPLHEADVPRMLKDFNCTLQLSGQSAVLVRSKLTVQRSWLLRANYELPESAVIMQLAVALEYGAYSFAYDDLWMSYRKGERSLFGETLETLVDFADTYLRANKKACPQPGVYAKVANPPPLVAPDHSTASPPRARVAAASDEESEGASDPAIIQQMLAAGPVNDDVAKQIRDTFKCVFHLQPWPQNRRNRKGHFFTKCKVCLEKYKCEYIGGRQQDRNDDNNDDSRPPRGRRAGGGDSPTTDDTDSPDTSTDNPPSGNPPPPSDASSSRSYAAAAANNTSSSSGGG